MSEQKPRKVEWTFSFDQIGQSVSRWLSSVGVGDQEVKTASFSEPVGMAAAAAIELDLSVGEVTVKPLPVGSANLFEAEVKYTGEIEFTVSGETEKHLKLGQKMPANAAAVVGPLKDVLNKVVNGPELHWMIGISPDVPVKLDIDDGVGRSRLDLTGLKLESLKVDNGVGETTLVLPSVERHYEAEIDGGIGHVHVTISEGAALHLKIEAGVGGVTIVLPTGAAARIEVERGLGGTSLPPHFVERGSGLWETPDFNSATRQITIEYEGGVGGLKVQ